MICILELKEESPNTKAQPNGWLIADDIDSALTQLSSYGAERIIEKIKELGNIKPGRYQLDNEGKTWLLAR